MFQQYIENYPHLCSGDDSPRRALERAPASPGALAAVMAVLEAGDEQAIERFAQQHARPEGVRSLSLQRTTPVFASDPEHDRDPAVVRARLARLGGQTSTRHAQPAPLQLKQGMRVRWPGHLSRRTPAAKAMIASLVKAGAMVACDDGFCTGPEVARAGAAAADTARAPLDASAAPGRNALEKCIAAMGTSVPGFSQLTWEEQLERASTAMHLGLVSA